MEGRKASAAHASVVVLKLRDFARKSVAEQAALTAKLDEALGAGLGVLAADERIVVDMPGGNAVVVLGNPAAALDFARRASAHASGAVAAALNHGPVRVLQGADAVVVGDGVSAADAIAGLAPSGRLVAAREFRDALSQRAPALSRHLARAGRFTDANDRSHDLFFADEAAGASRRRRFLTGTVLAVAAILVAGAIARGAIHRFAPAHAMLVFDVKPQGEVYVDGALKGKSPPLTQMQLAAGRHTIEVRRPLFKAFVQEIDVAPGDTLTIRHVFASPPATTRQREQQKSFWRRFLDKFR